MAQKSLVEALERAQLALQEAIDAASEEGTEAGGLDTPVGPTGGAGTISLPNISSRDLQRIVGAKRAGKGFDSQLAGINLACDEGC